MIGRIIGWIKNQIELEMEEQNHVCSKCGGNGRIGGVGLLPLFTMVKVFEKKCDRCDGTGRV